MLDKRTLWRFRLIMLSLLASVLLTTIWLNPTTSANFIPAKPQTMPNLTGIAPPDFFGVVARDPFYEWNTNPRTPGSNTEFLENMAREIKFMGARYVRIEFRADIKAGVRGGEINYAKYDAFINDIAPRYGLKILGLLGYGLVNWEGPGDLDLRFDRYNDPPDQPNGTNSLMRMYAFRARDIIARYGDNVGAWEMLNEVNYWQGVTLRPDAMGALMVYTFGLGKSANPNAKILVGAQLDPNDVATIPPFIYLETFLRSKPVQDYINRPRPAPFDKIPFPWDGIAWHPYFYDVADSIKSVENVIRAIRNLGDYNSKIWITEVGRPAHIEGAGACGETQEEKNQAQFLQEFYRQMIAKHLNDIAAVFWFKYEDFYDEKGQAVPYGLVRLEGNGGYAASGKVTRYKPAYYMYQRLAGPDLPVDPVPPPEVQRSNQNPTAPFYFKETGHTLNNQFLNYWLRNGGLELFGYPITEPFEELNPSDGKRYLVQYFERERFELHSEKAGTPYEVQLGLLGNDLVQRECKVFRPLPPPPDKLPVFRTYFRETGHYLSFAFKNYWEAHGGLAIFGYPISEEIVEISPIDGNSYTVQYFERARFELHPEAPPGAQVMLALLGTETLKKRGWL